MQFLEQFDPVSRSDPDARRGPLPHPVHRQDRRLLKRRREKSAGRMGLVMTRINKRLGKSGQFFPHPLGKKKFILQPDRYRPKKGGEAGRGQRKVGFQQTIKLPDWFFVKDHEVEVLNADACLPQAILRGFCRKSLIMLLAGKPFFLGCRDNLAIHHQGSGGIMVVRGDSENVHYVVWRNFL